MVHISTHILDTSLGRPANQVTIKLFSQNGDQWDLLFEGKTNSDGRVNCGDIQPPSSRILKLHFETEQYFKEANGLGEPFYPFAEIIFRVAEGETKYHVPLLLNPFGYSTYRGS